MVPAQQRLEPGDPVFREVDDGLVEQLELARGDGVAQIELEDAAGLRLDVHFRFEEVELRATVFLGAIQCHVGILQELIRVVAVVGRNRDPDARADDDMVIAEFERHAQGLDNARGQRGGGLHRLLCAGLHDRELVAAGSRDQILVAHEVAQARGNRAQQGIADGVAERIVDDLEVVEIQTEDGGVAAALDMFQRFFDVLAQLNAVCQSRQRVVMRQERDLLLRISLLGDIDVDGDRATGAQRRLGQRNDAPVLQLMLEA